MNKPHYVSAPHGGADSAAGAPEAERLLAIDAAHAWHPYTRATGGDPVYAVRAAAGCELELMDGRRLVDGMASWWCAIHGYNHPVLNAAARAQLECMAHVMFGGLTHAPAVGLVERLVRLTPAPLRHVFLCDSGSVAVEVAMKMALQYQQATGRAERVRFLTVRNGYHGDTFDAMSVCDPVNGMHALFERVLPRQIFAAPPAPRFDAPCTDADMAEMAGLMERHAGTVAAVILEPIVQGAGGMRFYAPEYLRRLRALCDQHGLLLILDEIATGFGRTGRLFACEHAGIAPDIMCLGKALTGGYLTGAATLATTEVAETLSRGTPGVFMHGPTFMANPLSCAIANASIDLLLSRDWQAEVTAVEAGLRTGLAACRQIPGVVDVRVLGAIGVVELGDPVPMAAVQHALVQRGVWVRPFGRLVYLMPPFIISPDQLAQLCGAVTEVLGELAAGRLHTPRSR